MQLQHAAHRAFQTGDGVIGIGTIGALGSIAGVNRAVGIDEHRRPVQIVVELELRQIHALHFHLPDGDEFLAGQSFDDLIALGNAGIKRRAGLARHATERHENRLVFALGLFAGESEIVVNPKVRALGVLVVERLFEAVGNLVALARIPQHNHRECQTHNKMPCLIAHGLPFTFPRENSQTEPGYFTQTVRRLTTKSTKENL